MRKKEEATKKRQRRKKGKEKGRRNGRFLFLSLGPFQLLKCFVNIGDFMDFRPHYISN